MTAPLPVWIAQPWLSPTAIADALMGGGFPAPHPTTGPAPRAAPAGRTRDRNTVAAYAPPRIDTAPPLPPPGRAPRGAPPGRKKDRNTVAAYAPPRIDTARILRHLPMRELPAPIGRGSAGNRIRSLY